MFWGIGLILLTIIADQGSKYLIDTHLKTGEIVSFGDYFNIVKVWNSGVSFSMFSNHGHLGAIVLTILALIVCAFLAHWMWHEQKGLKIVGLGLIIGGAIGNIIDRIRYEAVLDFLDFHYKNYHWPAFNLADTFICVGAFILIFMEICKERKKGEN